MGGIHLDKALAIEGWMSHIELNWLASVASECDNIFEIGSYLGRSTRALGDNCRGTVYSIDPYHGAYLFDNGSKFRDFDDNTRKQFIENIFDLFMNSKVIPIRATFKDRPSYLPSPNLIFIDGDHRYEQVKEDILEAKKCINKGGLIAGHDYTHADWPGVKRAVDELFGRYEINKIDSIWWVAI